MTGVAVLLWVVPVAFGRAILDDGPPPHARHEVDEENEIENDLQELKDRFRVGVKSRICNHFLNIENPRHFEESEELQSPMDLHEELDAEAR